MKRLTLEQFLERAKQKFPELDFSKVTNYINSSQKIIVICKTHGEIITTPNILLNPNITHICGKCYRQQNHTNIGIYYHSTEEFIAEVNRRWPFLPFSYEKVNYFKSHNYITVTCKLHGDFKCLAYNLVGNGYVCPKCNKNFILQKKIKSYIECWNTLYEQIVKTYPQITIDIAQLKSVFPNKRFSKIQMRCEQHGIFEINYENAKYFITKNQCPCKSCRGFCIDRNYTNEQFITILKSIYKNENFDYSMTIYKNWYSKVKIICPKHGEFLRLPQRLVEGRGCPYCKESLLERELRLFLDLKNINYIYQYRNKKILGKRSLDFYFPQWKAAIECQGKQHLSTDSLFSKGQTIEEIYQNDNEKRNMCIKAGIQLYYFSKFKVDNYIDKIYNNKEELIRTIINANK